MSADENLLEIFAEESEKTKKLRKKLVKHLALIDERVTQQALDRKVNEIHRWISRHALHRIPLKNKDISLFDENQNAAKVSQKISNFVLRLNEQFKDLQITKIEDSTLSDKEPVDTF